MAGAGGESTIGTSAGKADIGTAAVVALLLPPLVGLWSSWSWQCFKAKDKRLRAQRIIDSRAIVFSEYCLSVRPSRADHKK